MPLSAGNAYQGATAMIVFTLSSEETATNPWAAGGDGRRTVAAGLARTGLRLIGLLVRTRAHHASN